MKLHSSDLTVIVRLARVLLILLVISLGDANADDPAFSICLIDGSLGFGELLSSPEKNQLAFHVQGFAQPFVFAPNQVHSVRQLDYAEVPDKQQLQGQYLFTLRNHMQIVGKMVSMDDQSVSIESEHLGVLVLPRNELQRISRLNGAGRIIKKLFDSNDWSDPNNLNVWEIEGFKLKTNQPGSRFMSRYGLPQQAEFKISIAWTGKPSFSIGLGVAPDKKLNDLNIQWGVAEGQKPIPTTGRRRGIASLEVWEDSLVLVSETPKGVDFQQVQALKSDDTCELTVYVDLKLGTAAVQTVDGKVHQLKLDAKLGGVNDLGDSLKAVLLQNFGSGFTVERLDISMWDGELPVEYSASQSMVVLQDGSTHDGSIEGWNGPNSEWMMRTSSDQLRLPADQLKFINFAQQAFTKESEHSESPDAETNSEPLPNAERIEEVSRIADQSEVGELHLWLRDGSRINGQLQAGGEMGLSFFPAFGSEPKLVAFDQISEITTGAKRQAPPDATVNKVATVGLSKIQGELLSDPPSSSATALHWMPNCGLNTAELDYAFSGEIILKNLEKSAQASRRIKSQSVQAGGVGQARVVVAAPEGFNIFRQIFGGAAGVNQPKLADKRVEKKPLKNISKDSQIRFRSGDVAPAVIVKVSEDGVKFESSRTATTFAPNHAIDQIFFQQSKGSKITEDERKRLLIIPRAQKADPPTHLLISLAGDYLRGHLIEVNPQSAIVEVRGELMEFPTEELSEIVWLYDRNWQVAANTGSSDKDTQPAAMEDSESAVHVIVGGNEGLTILPQKVQAGVLDGVSPLLGESSIKLADVTLIFFGPDAGKKARQRRSETYELSLAKAPKESADSPDGDSTQVTNHPLIDNPAPDFSLKQLSGDVFHLAEQRGQIIVLDFWASWCGPCMQAMPQLDELIEEIGDTRIQLIAVNIQETKPRIELALQKLGVNCGVVLDADGEVAAAYKANSIPQTVIIDKSGMVADVIVGGGPKALGKIRQTIGSLLQKENDPTRAQ